MEAWIDGEIKAGAFPDVRLAKRCGLLMNQLAQKIGETVPTACQDWAATKAAYRFFDNKRIDEAKILAGHFDATASRVKREDGPILVLHDTTEITFNRTHPERLGFTREVRGKSKADGRRKTHKICGVLLHASLATTPAGIPLGLAASRFWTRKQFKGSRALDRKVHSTRVPIETKESFRWVQSVESSTQVLGDASRCIHVGDRESDIYELFTKAQEIGTHFLIRTRVDRTTQGGGRTMLKRIDTSPIRGRHTITMRDAKTNQKSKVNLRIRHQRMTLLAPRDKRKANGPVEVTVIHARESGRPNGRDPLSWRLVTDLPVTTMQQAIEKLDWYATRWKIETYFNVLKSGCKIESSRLQTAQRLANLVALCSVVAWRTFWLTMTSRHRPEAPAKDVFTPMEIKILNNLVKRGKISREPGCRQTVRKYVRILARLGGFLARKDDGEPGNKTLWRGLSRLTDIHLGYEAAVEVMGN